MIQRSRRQEKKNYLVISRRQFGCSLAPSGKNVRSNAACEGRREDKMEKTATSRPALITTEETVLCANLLATPPRLTPTGKISHAKTRVYTQRYRKEWEQMPDFKGTSFLFSLSGKERNDEDGSLRSLLLPRLSPRVSRSESSPFGVIRTPPLPRRSNFDRSSQRRDTH